LIAPAGTRLIMSSSFAKNGSCSGPPAIVPVITERSSFKMMSASGRSLIDPNVLSGSQGRISKRPVVGSKYWK